MHVIKDKLNDEVAVREIEIDGRSENRLFIRDSFVETYTAIKENTAGVPVKWIVITERTRTKTLQLVNEGATRDTILANVPQMRRFCRDKYGAVSFVISTL